MRDARSAAPPRSSRARRRASDIQETAPGKLTRPLKSDDGYTLLAVCTAKSIQSNAAARVQAEAKLIDELNKDLGKDYMDELRKKAVIEYMYGPAPGRSRLPPEVVERCSRHRRWP